MEMEGFEKRVLMSGAWRVLTQHTVVPWVLAVDGLPARARVLELGSGAGFNAEALLRRERLRRRSAAGRVTVATGDAVDIQVAGMPFDLVVSIGVWHHLGEWERALEQCSSVLLPGGQLLLADLSPGFFRGPLRRLFPPVRTYTASELRVALRAAGFMRWEMERVGSIGYRVLAERSP